MNRSPRWLSAVLVGVLALAAWLVPGWAMAADLAPIPTLDSPVVDTTGTLDAATRQRLVAQALALQKRKGSQLQVLVVSTTKPEDIAQYAVRVYDQWRLGREKTDDGVLLVVARDDRRVRIEVGYGLEGAITDATSSRVIQEYLVPRFRAGDYAGGITEATAVLVKLIDGEPLPPPVASGSGADDSRKTIGQSWMLALFAALMIGRGFSAVFRSMPRLLRSLCAAAAAGLVAWMVSSLLVVGGIGAFLGFFLGLFGSSGGRFAGDRGSGGWGAGGGWGGGGMSSGGSGGGWSGGGGMSGGGGASGSW